MELSFPYVISYFDTDLHEFVEGRAKFIDRYIYHSSTKLGDIRIELPESKLTIKIEDHPPHIVSFSIFPDPLSRNFVPIGLLMQGTYRLDTANKLEEFYNNLNNTLEEIENKIECDILSIINDISVDDYIGLAYNFIDLLPNNEYYFLINDYYFGFETFLAYDSIAGKFTTDVSDDLRHHYLQKLSEDEDYQTNIDIFINEVRKFTKVISKRISIPKDYELQITWLMIKKAAIKYFSDKWSEEYGNYLQFFNLDKSIEELLVDYLACDVIDHQSAFPAHKFIYYLLDKKNDLKQNYGEIVIEIDNNLVEMIQNLEFSAYEERLLNGKDNTNSNQTSIDDIDLMSGSEFEQFVAQIFEKMGYSTTVTKHSGDQGIDVIAEKNGQKIGIQAKCYSGSVGNSAIQEATAGKKYYGLNKVMVVTNNYFTQSAIELANSNNVILWDRTILKEKLSAL